MSNTVSPADSASEPTHSASKAQPNRKNKRKARRQAGPPRAGSKKATVIALLKRPKGATLEELTKATGWQPHSVRGFLSGSLRKSLGLKIKSSKHATGQRAYQLKT